VGGLGEVIFFSTAPERKTVAPGKLPWLDKARRVTDTGMLGRLQAQNRAPERSRGLLTRSDARWPGGPTVTR